MGLFDFFKSLNDVWNKDGYDEEGFNRLGYNAEGFDRNGFDKHGFDKDGFDENGFHKTTKRDREGFDQKGFDKDGYDKNGWNAKGFNRFGFDKDGFNFHGYDKDGFNRKGFNSDGFDRAGFNEKGFNKDGFNILGYDEKGFNKYGYDQEGFNREGFNKFGYGRDGFNQDGFDKEGFNRVGFNKQGFGRDGFDRDGFDKHGFGRDGFNREGFNKQGFDREGFDKKGFDSEGFGRDGFNKKNLDREGFNREGFNLLGLTRQGYTKDDFDEDGFHKTTGLDPLGYNRAGYNDSGINRYTQKDKLGYNVKYFDSNDFNIWGFNIKTRLSSENKTVDFYNDNPNFTQEKLNDFLNLYRKYIAGRIVVAKDLAVCYYEGIGTIQNYQKALYVLLDYVAAFPYDEEALLLLQQFFNTDGLCPQMDCAEEIIARLNKSDGLDKLFSAQHASDFTLVDSDPRRKTLKEENAHLDGTLDSIKSRIASLTSHPTQPTETHWMNPEAVQYHADGRLHLEQDHLKADDLKELLNCPYYARWDIKNNNTTKTIYIGEKPYVNLPDEQFDVVSHYSDLGSAYRKKSTDSITIEGETFYTKLKRNITIKNSELVDFADTYVLGSTAQQENITDPFLQRVLQERKHVKNITNIIRTIQETQNDVIEQRLNSNFIVQGCAGSGKTMVLLQRLANLKYNNPSFSWQKVKIITPNPNFSLYIDTISKNLKLEEISRLTLAEYYLKLLERYQDENYYVTLDDQKEFHYTAELKAVQDDIECEKRTAAFIYSNSFINILKKQVERWLQNNRSVSRINFSKAYKEFKTIFNIILASQGYPLKKYRNYTCVLYAKALFLYYVYGPLRNTEKLICVDEGQDIGTVQYKLLDEINNHNTYWNVFGDYNQRISDFSDIDKWSTLSEILGKKTNIFTLNENYRNCEEIIDYCQSTLGVTNASFGIKSKPVSSFCKNDLTLLVKLHLFLGNQIVIIANDFECIPKNILEYCSIGKILDGKATIMNVRQVKGLEFDVAFVFDEQMSANERYVSYTRALSQLFIYSSTADTHFKYQRLPCAKTSNAKKQNTLTKKPLTKEQEKTTLSYLIANNKARPLILARDFWGGDFCFVVEKIEKDHVVGTQYLDGVTYKTGVSYDLEKTKWLLYNGPSRETILNQIKEKH